MKIEENAKSFFGFFVSKLKVSLVSSVIGVIKVFKTFVKNVEQKFNNIIYNIYIIL